MPAPIRTGKLSLNPDHGVVEVDDRPLHLSRSEYAIIELLSLRKGSTVSKELLLDHLYGRIDRPKLRSVMVILCKLRKKLASATGGEHYIETVGGRGYALRDPA